MNGSIWETVSKKLIWYKDCTEPLTDADFEIGESYVVSAPAGLYRETGKQDDSRYGYRFTVPHPDKPCLMTVTYPDDKARVICVQDGTSYDLSFGLHLGGDLKNTGKMQTAYNLFWARATDESVLISSVEAVAPAAASSIAVYELESLPEALPPFAPGTRSFGIQYEDPCNIGASEGATDFREWLEHHIQFMKATGQNRLVYPVNWYHGPTVPVLCQPAARCNTVVTAGNGDRKFFTRSVCGDFPDWLDTLLNRFDREGFVFTGALTLLRLGNLMKEMNADGGAVRAGADTVNTVLYDGTVQASTGDWTGIYNPLIYPDYAAARGDCNQYQLAYGEERRSRFPFPIFNVLHPTVQKQVLAYFRELAGRYAVHPSFAGLSINFWHGTILWFGNLLAGYDDICVALFEEDTGIPVPVAPDNPHRFEERYRWLMENARDAWIDFRCRRVHAQIANIRDVLCSVRPDLVLTVNIWNETSRSNYIGAEMYPPSRQAPSAQYGICLSNETFYRYAGIDLSLFKNEKNIHLCVERDGRDVSHDNSWPSAARYPGRTLTDPFFLETGLYRHLKELPASEGFHFDCWIERWGQHSVFPCGEKDREELDIIRNLSDYRPDFVHRENCRYADEDGRRFFYSEELRITSLFPESPYFLEQLTADLALHDVLSVTSGGLYLNKSHADEQRTFALEYRKLPAVRFTDIPGVTDPVCMRYLCSNGKTWIYLVNREPYEISVDYSCGMQSESLSLSPFALRVFQYGGENSPTNIRVSVPIEITEGYRADGARLLEALNLAEKQNPPYAKGIPVIREQVSAALDAEHFSELRHLLQCYVAASAGTDAGKVAGR